jgi:hypothetical protein
LSALRQVLRDLTMKDALQSKTRAILSRAGMFILLGMALLAPYSPAYAMAEPTSVTLSNIQEYNGLVVAGDALFIVPYEIPFASTPSVPIGNAFLFRMLNAAGTADIGAAIPFPYHELGYGSGIFSFYFTSGIVANTAYIFRVQENPAYYPTPLYWDFVIGPANYSSATDQSAALKAELISWANIFSTEYTQALLTTTEGTTTLSTYGETYFLNAVPGLSVMCPTLFAVQIRTPSYTPKTWATTYADSLKTKFAGTFVEDFMTGFAGLTGASKDMSGNVLSIILVVIMALASLVWFKATFYSALIDGYALLLLFTLDTFSTMLVAGFIAFMSVVLGGVVWLLNRS